MKHLSVRSLSRSCRWGRWSVSPRPNERRDRHIYSRRKLTSIRFRSIAKPPDPSARSPPRCEAPVGSRLRERSTRSSPPRRSRGGCHCLPAIQLTSRASRTWTYGPCSIPTALENWRRTHPRLVGEWVAPQIGGGWAENRCVRALFGHLACHDHFVTVTKMRLFGRVRERGQSRSILRREYRRV